MKTAKSLTLAATLLCLSACTTIIDTTTNQPIETDPGERSFGTYLDDQRLEVIASVNINKADPELRLAHVNVTSFNNIMLLTGQVPTEALKALAQQTAEKINNVETRLKKVQEEEDMEGFKQLIVDLEIPCPVSGSKNWTDVRQFNLMFSTEIGSLSDGSTKIYLRPETAQGIFVNFLNVQKSGRMKIPFGIAQTGKAFRNEIVARQFIFRMREFEQMEMQYFIKPGTQKQWYEHWKEARMKWHLSLGMGADNYRFHDHEKLAHYADAASDIEFKFPFGFKELEGIHSRTDFDLSQHEKHSGKKLQYFDHEENKNYTPYVLETSIGLDRMFLAVFSNALIEETLDNNTTRTVLKLPAVLAPIKAAVLPLVKKDGLPEIAKTILADLQWDFNVVYDEKDAVGRRYRRQDALGTPFCITVDHDSLEDNCVTIRHRDSMEQQRVKIEDLRTIIENEVAMKHWLKKIN